MALSKKVEFSKQKRQEFLDLQNKKEALKIETNKEVLVLKEKLDTLNSIFNTQLKVSDFDTRELVQKAILLDADLVRFSKNKEAIKSMSEEERHKFKLEFLDAQIALKEKMKGILNSEQYTKYSQMMDRKMKSRRGKGKRKK